MNAFAEMSIASLTASVNSLHWIGAASFEDRCVSSITRLAEQSALSSVTLLQYRTRAYPSGAAEDRRFRNTVAIREIANNIGVPIAEHEIDPYRLSGLITILDSLRSHTLYGRILFDVSCLTKVHAIAVAYWLSDLPEQDAVLAYTVPEHYGSSAHRRPALRWREVVFSPIGLPVWRDEGDAGFVDDEDDLRDLQDGVLLVGHEGSRMSLALAEAVPKRGLIVTAHDDDWIGLESEARVANDQLLRRASLPSANWPQAALHRGELGKLYRLVREYLADGATAGRRIVIYPFGPKPLIVAAALACLREAPPDRVWFSYPVPMSYDASYSFGARATSWYAATDTKPESVDVSE